MAEEKPSNNSAETRNKAVWLWLLRTALLILSLFEGGSFLTGLPLLYRSYLTICPAAVCRDDRLNILHAAQLEALGLSLEWYAWFNILLVLVMATVCFAAAAILVWKRSNDVMALYVAIFLVQLGGGYSVAEELPWMNVPGMEQIIVAQNQLAFVMLPILFYLFPDGRFVPRWTRWMALLLIGNTVFDFFAPDLIAESSLLLPAVLLYLVPSIYAQVYRYRRVSGPVERQQTKWALYGLSTAITVFVGITILYTIFNLDARAPVLVAVALDALLYVAVMLIPISIGIAILRYRLFDIDVIIRRTLIYTALTVLLALMYFSSVVAFQQLFTIVTGRVSEVAVVISTLLIAALFAPLRRRVQDVIDRRFFRRKYDAQQVLARFAATARDETNVDQLTAELIRVVQETMQPAHMSVWLIPAADRKGTIVRAVN